VKTDGDSSGTCPCHPNHCKFATSSPVNKQHITKEIVEHNHASKKEEEEARP